MAVLITAVARTQQQAHGARPTRPLLTPPLPRQVLITAVALALQSIDYAYTADGILLEDCLGCYPASHAFLMYLIPSGGDGDFSPQARSLVKVILLIVQALLFLFLLLLAFLVHREFGWRTFSYVAAAQIPLNAHRAWTKSRTLLEWLLVGDAAHLLGLALIWPQIPDVLPRDLLIPFFLVLAVDGAWLGLTFLSFGSRRHFLILLKWLPTHAALGRPPESAPDEDEIFCEAVWGPAVFTLLLLLGLLLPAAAAYGASSVAMEAVAFVADGMPAFVLFSFAIVLLRLAALLSLAFVWQFRSPLHEYFTKGRRNHGDLHHLPAFVQRHVRRDVDEEALRFCCVGMKVTRAPPQLGLRPPRPHRTPRLTPHVSHPTREDDDPQGVALRRPRLRPFARRRRAEV